MAPEEENQSITSCAMGHVGNTTYPKSQEPFRSGRSANMIDKEGHYVQTSPVRRALEDAVRDFVLTVEQLETVNLEDTKILIATAIIYNAQRQTPTFHTSDNL